MARKLGDLLPFAGGADVPDANRGLMALLAGNQKPAIGRKGDSGERLFGWIDDVGLLMTLPGRQTNDHAPSQIRDRAGSIVDAKRRLETRGE